MTEQLLVVMFLAILAIPYSYVITGVASKAYFNAKLHYQMQLVHELGRTNEQDEEEVSGIQGA